MSPLLPNHALRLQPEGHVWLSAELPPLVEIVSHDDVSAPGWRILAPETHAK